MQKRFGFIVDIFSTLIIIIKKLIIMYMIR